VAGGFPVTYGHILDSTAYDTSSVPGEHRPGFNFLGHKVLLLSLLKTLQTVTVQRSG